MRAIPIGDRHDDPAWEGRLENEIRRTLAHWAQKFGLAAPRTLQLAALDGGIGLERLRRGLAMNVVPYDVFAALVSARAPGVAPVSLGPEMAGAAAAVLLRREPLIELSPAAVVTERTTRRRMRLRFATAALAAIAFVPPVLYHRAQAAQTLRRAQEAERELRLVASVQAIDAARQREIEQLQARVQALLPAYMARDGWSRFLAELQEEVSAVENAWIERLQVVGPPLGRAGTVAEARRLLVSGRLEADGAASAAERARHLLGRVAASVFVAAIEGEQFERAGNGSLRFTVTLVLKPGAML